MKDFMLIFIGPSYEELGLSPEQMQERMGRWFAWNGKMQAQGVVKGGDALHPGGKRVSGSERTVTDGPFVESKELIGGYYIVQAKDYEGAIAIAQDFPDYDLDGSVEIREVINFDAA